MQVQDTDAKSTEMPELAVAGVQVFFRMIDADANGEISWEEFQHKYASMDVKMDPTYTPQQIHMFYPNDPTQMIVMWSSGLVSPDSSVVEIGTSPGVYTKSYNGNWTTYTVKYDPLNIYTSLPIHRTNVNGLKPSTRYFYRCGKEGNWSKELNFTSAPQFYNLSTTPTSFTWAMYGYK